MLSFVSVVFLFSAEGVLFYPFLGNGISAHSSVSSQFGTLFEMILNIFPANILSPFVEGNTLQIIFLPLSSVCPWYFWVSEHLRCIHAEKSQSHLSGQILSAFLPDCSYYGIFCGHLWVKYVCVWTKVWDWRFPFLFWNSLWNGTVQAFYRALLHTDLLLFQ